MPYKDPWIFKVIDSIIGWPTYWFDKTHGSVLLKLLAFIWFFLWMFPCMLIGGPLTLIALPFMLWSDME